MTLENWQHQLFLSVIGGLGNSERNNGKIDFKTRCNTHVCKSETRTIDIETQFENELEKFLKDGVLEKCDFSEWATPIVPVSKKYRSIRASVYLKILLIPFKKMISILFRGLRTFLHHELEVHIFPRLA